MLGRHGTCLLTPASSYEMVAPKLAPINLQKPFSWGWEQEERHELKEKSYPDHLLYKCFNKAGSQLVLSG